MGFNIRIAGAYISLCLVAGLLSACSGTQSRKDNVDPYRVRGDPQCENDRQAIDLREKLERHVVRINQDGFAIRPDISLFGHKEKFFDELLSRPVFEEKIDKMLACAERLADSKTTDRSKRRRVRLLIHVHGGLNFFADTDDRVTTLGTAIQHDGEDWYYPIFVSWPSSALGTFGEHLWSVRGGRKVSPVHGAISLPFVLVSDLLQVGNVVTSMYLQAERVTNEIALNTSLSREGAPQGWLKVTRDGLPTAWRNARSNHDQAQNNRSIQAPETYWSGYYYPDSLALSTDYIGRHALKTLTYPIRATVGTAYNGAVVESAWRNMKRRTNNIFYPPARAYKANGENDVSDQCKAKGEDIACVEGGRFFQYLLKRIGEKNAYEYDITLVGHSMGTIVLNNAFKRYRPDWIGSGAVRNIVYMAAAASIRDTMDSVFPILLEINNTKKKNPAPVKFYNLTLNRLAEISETTVWSFLPNGSLLVNIDDHLEQPETLLDRTMGQEVNVLSVLPVIRDALRGAAKHTQFKSFDRYPGCGPDAHGAFNDMPFWRKSFWTVSNDPGQGLPARSPTCPYNAYPNNCLDLLRKDMEDLSKKGATELHGSLREYLSQWCGG